MDIFGLNVSEDPNINKIQNISLQCNFCFGGKKIVVLTQRHYLSINRVNQGMEQIIDRMSSKMKHNLFVCIAVIYCNYCAHDCCGYECYQKEDLNDEFEHFHGSF